VRPAQALVHAKSPLLVCWTSGASRGGRFSSNYRIMPGLYVDKTILQIAR
jgi:hypothetical protein